MPLENPSIEGITTLAKNFTHLATLSANFLSFAVSGAFCDRAAVGTALEITLEVAADTSEELQSMTRAGSSPSLLLAQPPSVQPPRVCGEVYLVPLK